MKNCFIKSVKFVLLTCVAATVLFGCGGTKYSEDEIKTAVSELIEASYEINEIYFGEGLPVKDKNGASDGSEDADSNMSLNYSEVSEESKYHSVEEIKEATLKVYSREYSEALFEIAFSGFSVDIGEDDAARTYNVTYARYIEYEGILTERIVDDDKIIKTNRTYDLSEIKIKRQRNGIVKIELPSYIDGEYSMDVSLTLKMTENGWRLDTPTY